MVCGGGQGGATARRKLSPKEFLQKSLSTQPLNEFFTFSYIAEGRWWANADRTDSISFSLPVPCKSSGSFFLEHGGYLRLMELYFGALADIESEKKSHFKIL